jgi:hypothetical protein
MGFWEFLIQKEGDRSWLPLESPDVEVLEGRYRVVARSSHLNTPVEIRVTQDAIAEDPPKRRVQKRTGKTNPDGLLVVMPFTRLQPGVWELRCASDVMADMLGETWRHTVNLQVVSLDAGGEDWDDSDDSDWFMGAHDAAVAPHAPSGHPELTDEPTGDRVLALVDPLPAQPLAATSSQPASGDPVEGADPALDEGSTVSPIPTAQEPAELPLPQPDDREPDVWNLALTRDTYSVQRGQTLTLQGEIHGPAQPAQPVYLQVRLWDPQTADVLHDRADLVPVEGDRTPFECTVTIPSDCQTRLMLGELRLIGEETHDPALASQTFAVTVNLDELLEAIADSYAMVDTVHPPLEFADTAEVFPLALEFLNLVNEPRVELSTTPASDHPLPPQIYQPDPTTPRTRIELPIVPAIEDDIPAAERQPALSETDAAVPAPDDEPTPDESMLSVEPDLAPSLEPGPELSPEPSQELSQEAIAVSPVTLEMSQADAPLEPDAAILNPPTAKPPAPMLWAPEAESFRSLNLTDRFWSKLQGFIAQPAAPAEPEPPIPEPVAIAVDMASDEFVVDDDPQPLESLAAPLPPRAVAETEPLPQLSEDEAIPIPHLEVTEGELISGQWVAVLVTLPILETRLSVKVWIHDRQSRTLLEGPRWLVDFIPTGFGDQQSRLQMPVPYGCTHIQIEAIAVEMATQRESHKISLERSVVPPNLPALMLDDFGF